VAFICTHHDLPGAQLYATANVDSVARTMQTTGRAG
jgi:hypothetical protein